MTRDAEHTPTGYEDAASVVVNQAPAPSSLAGGEALGRITQALVQADEEFGGMSAYRRRVLSEAILSALPPEAPAREGYEDAELSVLDREVIDRSFRTIQAYDAVRDLQAALLDTMKRQHTGYDWNADPDQMTLKQGNALALATKVFSDLNAAVDARDTISDADWEDALTPRHEAPASPVSDRYKFDDEIAWLREAARYFSARDTRGEDRAHWANVYNAENARKLADRLAELSSNPCQLEAPAEGAGERQTIIEAVKVAMNDAWCDITSDTYCWPADLKRVSQRGPVRLEYRPRIWTETTAELAADAILALRARSTAPEAREGEAVRRQRCTRCDRGEVFGMSDDSGFWVEFSSVAGGGNEHGMNGWLELVEHWPDGRDVRREYVAKDSPLYAAPSADKLRDARQDVINQMADNIEKLALTPAKRELVKAAFRACIGRLSTPDALRGDAK